MTEWLKNGGQIPRERGRLPDAKTILQRIVILAGSNRQFVANLVGVDAGQFSRWMKGSEPITIEILKELVFHIPGLTPDERMIIEHDIDFALAANRVEQYISRLTRVRTH